MKPHALLLLLFASSCGATGSNAPPPTECRCEAGCLSACEVDESVTTTYRKVERDPSAPAEPVSPPEEGFEAAEVDVDVALEPAEMEKVLARLKKAPEDVVAAFHGDFARRKGQETAVVLRSGELLILTTDTTYAKLQLGSPLEDTAAVRAVQLVDSRAEIVVRHVETGVERFTVCRVVGRAIGRVFDIEVGGRTIDFVRRGDEKAIRVAELTGAGQTVSVYRWNPWEGMFRVPTPAPTAPPPS